MKLWHDLKNYLEILVLDPRVGAATSIYTLTAGIGAAIISLQGIFAALATLAGAILSTVLVYNHYKKGKLEREFDKLKIQAMEKILSESNLINNQEIKHFIKLD